MFGHRLHSTIICPVLRAGLYLLAGVLLLFRPASSIETLIPAAVALLLADAALIVLGGATGSRWVEAAWSAAMALAIYLRPIYSILTLSFVLLLQLIVWLAGKGMLAMAEWAIVAPARSTPKARAARRIHRLDPAAGLLLTGAGLALLFSPGAGALDRQPALGLIAVVWAGILWLKKPSFDPPDPAPPDPRIAP